MRGRLAWKANHYGQCAEAAKLNADTSARHGGSAATVARLRGLQEALEMAARDFAVLAEG